MKKRMFIALDITPADKNAVARWREQCLPLPFKKIPHNNFHITLAFLGILNETQQQDIEQLISEQHDLILQQLGKFLSHQHSFSLSLAQLGHFNKAQVLHLIPSYCPEWLAHLQKLIVRVCDEGEITVDNRAYQPHLSLYRKAKMPIMLPSSFAIDTPLPVGEHQWLTINSFSLYHSKSTSSGVTYIPIHAWKLNF